MASDGASAVHDYHDATGVDNDVVLTATREPPCDAMTPFSVENANDLVDAFWHVPDAVVMVDTAGKVVWANRAAERLFGQSLRDWVGESEPLDGPPRRLRARPALPELHSGQGRRRPDRDPGEVPQGWRLVEMVGTTVPWSDGRVVLLCLRDLTERRRFEVASGRRGALPLASCTTPAR